MALEVQSSLLAGRTVGERNVVVSNIIEEVDLLLLEKKSGSDGMDWSVTPSLVEESSVLIQRLEEVSVCLRSEPVEVTDFKVRPL